MSEVGFSMSPWGVISQRVNQLYKPQDRMRDKSGICKSLHSPDFVNNMKLILRNPHLKEIVDVCVGVYKFYWIPE
jgi:hypothetical protein